MKGETAPRLTLPELCDPFRVAAETIGAVLVADRPEARKLITAFMLSPLPPWRRPRTRMPEDHRELWVWLWTGFEGGPHEPSFLDDLAVSAGISTQTAYTLWPQLMASRLVFPDGTITQEAREILRAHVAKTLPRAQKGS